MTRKTSILVIGYNRPWLIELKLLKLASSFEMDLVVSIDATKSSNLLLRSEWLRLQEKFPNVRWRLGTENLGLARHVTCAISQELVLYENVIVLEDDVVVNLSTLEIARKVLQKRLPQDVLTIGFFGGMPNFWPLSHFARNYWRRTRYFSAWGWAIQREDWKDFSLDIAISKSSELAIEIQKTFSGHKQRHWQKRAERVKGNPQSTWDYQMFFLGLLLHKKHLLPTFRTCDNVGFDSELATNTKTKKPFWYLGPSSEALEESTSILQNLVFSKSLQSLDSLTWVSDSRLYGVIRRLKDLRNLINKHLI